MFMQVVQGHVRDADGLRRRAEVWNQELKPGADGFLGSTAGVTADGMGVVVARFESEAAAMANSHRPEQSAWWEETKAMFEDDVEFIDCPDCDVVMGGGSDDAHFVQLIECRAKDKEALRQAGMSMEADLRERRPEIMGGIVGWHGDDFVQVMYFTDEEHARMGEKSMQDDAEMSRWMDMMDGQPRFLDLRDPTYA